MLSSQEVQHANQEDDSVDDSSRDPKCKSDGDVPDRKTEKSEFKNDAEEAPERPRLSIYSNSKYNSTRIETRCMFMHDFC